MRWDQVFLMAQISPALTVWLACDNQTLPALASRSSRKHNKQLIVIVGSVPHCLTATLLDIFSIILRQALSILLCRKFSTRPSKLMVAGGGAGFPISMLRIFGQIMKEKCQFGGRKKENCSFCVGKIFENFLYGKFVSHLKRWRYIFAWLQVRSKIARGACDQPKAGCMGPVVSRTDLSSLNNLQTNLLQNVFRGLGWPAGPSCSEMGGSVCGRWLQGRLQETGPQPLPWLTPKQEDR